MGRVREGVRDHRVGGAGTMTGSDGQQAAFVGEVFRRFTTPLKEAAEGCPTRTRRQDSARSTDRPTVELTAGRDVAHRHDAHDAAIVDHRQCRKPNANIDSSASWASASGPIVFGSFVMNSVT